MRVTLLEAAGEQSTIVPEPAIVPSMQAVTFAGCFGWFHSVGTGNSWDTAALLCPGVGQDGGTGYRSYRLLADELAKAGYPTLRFDYLGTGDSRDTEDVQHWATWQTSVIQALRWLRANTQSKRLVLVGLRIGATLAAIVAEQRHDVAGLILLAPVLRGKTYISQLAMEARTRGHGSAAESGSVALGQLSLSGEAQQQMRLVDLRRVELRADCRVAIYAHEQSPVLTDCVATWRSRGVDVTPCAFDGLDALLRPPNFADEPAADFSAITAWLRQAVPRHPSASSAQPATPYLGLQVDGCVETVIRFGAGRHLCGVLSRPTQEADPTFAVVIANSGGNPHHGFARFSVRFARYLARAGIASFRLDFAGLGDSRSSASEDGPTHVFEVDRTNDMAAAAGALEALGYLRFAAHGVCSGAYHALRAVAADPRFDTALLLNLPWFTLRHEKASPSSSARRIVAALAERQTRAHFLFGETDPGVRQFERHFGTGGGALLGWSSAVVQTVSGWDHDLTGHVMQDAAAAAMLRFLRHAEPRTPSPGLDDCAVRRKTPCRS